MGLLPDANDLEKAAEKAAGVAAQDLGEVLAKFRTDLMVDLRGLLDERQIVVTFPKKS